MPVAGQYQIEGGGAQAIAESLERAIQDGALAPGDRLPTIRALAEELDASPVTVAAAYRLLRGRGLVVAAGRAGTRVAPRPPLAGLIEPEVPPRVRDLRIGLPDPALLPPLQPALAAAATGVALPSRRHQRNEPRLLELARAAFAADGVPATALAVVGGAMDGVERVLGSRLVPGDAVAVEDPLYPPLVDLLRTLGLSPVGVAVDDAGMLPDGLAAALRRGARALVLTPRAHNPTGAALTRERAGELRDLLAGSAALVVEDDHAGPVAGPPAASSIDPARGPWAVVRSVSKSLHPDLRLAIVSGDEQTISRVERRQALGTGWVSTILQRTVAALWSDRDVVALLARARAAYAERRTALVRALAAAGIPAQGRSGLNVWVPVRQESATVESLLAAGWAVAAGERFRLRSGPGIRITVSELAPGEAPELAAALARALRPAGALGAY